MRGLRPAIGILNDKGSYKLACRYPRSSFDLGQTTRAAWTDARLRLGQMQMDLWRAWNGGLAMLWAPAKTGRHALLRIPREEIRECARRGSLCSPVLRTFGLTKDRVYQ
jgi:hypothetical protein